MIKTCAKWAASYLLTLLFFAAIMLGACIIVALMFGICYLWSEYGPNISLGLDSKTMQNVALWLYTSPVIVMLVIGIHSFASCVKDKYFK
jgi:hypothetical protein